jgi:hypothetical protein
MRRYLALVAVAVLGASVDRASASAPEEPAAHAAVSLAVHATPIALRAHLTHPPAGGVFAPPNPACTVEVGQQARDAYASARRPGFASPPAGAAADLTLEIVGASGDLEWDADGWRAVVEHALVLRDGAGAELGRWTVRGVGRVRGLGERAIPVAFREAADAAAGRFEALLAEPGAAATWLRARGVAISPRPGPPPAATQPPLLLPASGSPRGRWLAFADVGGALVTTVPAKAESGSAEDFGEAGAVQARAGLAAPSASIRVAFARWRASFDPQPTSVSADRAEAVLTAFGVEAGPVIRLARTFDVEGGLGAHLLHGSATADRRPYSPGSIASSASRIVPVVYGAVTYAGVAPGLRLRLRFGVEVRRYLGTSLPFDELGREIAVGETSIGALIGVELPLR